MTFSITLAIDTMVKTLKRCSSASIEPANGQVSQTDAHLSVAADEFVWSEAGLSHTFNYIFPGVVRWLKEANARSVLDLGCGNGAFANELAKAGFEVTGIDASESGIAFASKSYRTVQFLHADLRNPLPEGFRRSYDAVLAIEVIEHLL